MTFARRTLLLAALAAALVYLPRLSAPLMWDDRPFLLDAPAYDHPLPAKFYVSPAYFPVTGELTWRPLSTLSYAVLVRAFGRNPAPLRASILLLHAVNAALLAWLIILLGLDAEIAAIAAALFLIHPVHLETLMTVTFDKEVLSTFGILALLVAHKKRRAPLGALGLLAACLAKESGVVGLPLVVGMDALTGDLKKRAKDHALYALATAAYLIARFGPLKGPGGEADLSALLPWTERLYYAAQSFVSSFRVLLAPAGLRIEYFALPASSPLEYAAWIMAAVALLGGLIALARRERRLSFFVLWPLPALFLVSNLIPAAVLSTRLMAERWLYLPAVGLCAALAILFRRRCVLLLVFWAALGLLRAHDWSSETALWRSLVRVYPWSAKAAEGLGEAEYRAGDARAALGDFERGLALRETREDRVLAHYVPLAPPGTIAWESAPLYRWLGLCRLRLGDERAAVAEFEKAVALQPSDGFSYRVLAYTTADLGDFKTAKVWLDRGFARDPSDDFLLRLKPDVARRHLAFRARFD